MAKAKSARIHNSSDKQVITMPEAGPTSIKKNVAPVSSSPVSFAAPDLEGKIRQRAYELYEQRGYTVGFDKEDWFKAEREILIRSEKRQQSA